MDIWTDGSCLGNPGPGGWAYYIPELHKEGSGKDSQTTNNKMELVAIWQGLTVAEAHIQGRGYSDGHLTVFSDSQWAINCLTRKWKAQKNLELINQIWLTVQRLDHDFDMQVGYQWVRGHNGTKGNEVVDKLARQAAHQV